MESLSIICAVLCGLAVWLWPRRNVCDVGERAGNVVGRAGESLDEKPDGGFDGRSDGIEEANMPSKPLPAIGCVACVASLRASVRSGATLVQAFEELGGTPFATPELTRLRITMVIRSRCPPKEQCGQVERLSGELYAYQRIRHAQSDGETPDGVAAAHRTFRGRHGSASVDLPLFRGQGLGMPWIRLCLLRVRTRMDTRVDEARRYGRQDGMNGMTI